MSNQNTQRACYEIVAEYLAKKGAPSDIFSALESTAHPERWAAIDQTHFRIREVMGLGEKPYWVAEHGPTGIGVSCDTHAGAESAVLALKEIYKRGRVSARIGTDASVLCGECRWTERYLRDPEGVVPGDTLTESGKRTLAADLLGKVSRFLLAEGGSP